MSHRLILSSRLLVAVAAGLGCAAPAAAQPPGAAVRIYVDQAHGEFPPPPPMTELATRHGYAITLGRAAIDAAALAGHRLAYLRAPNMEITAAERDVLVAFVNGGGSLLLVLDEESRQSLATTRVNDLLKPFGLALTADTPYLHNNGAIARTSAITATDRELPYSGGRAVEGGTPFAWQLDKDGKAAQPFAAYVQVPGGGRVIVMGEGMASLFLGTREGVRLTGIPRDPTGTTYWGKDSAPFMADVFAWLVGR